MLYSDLGGCVQRSDLGFWGLDKIADIGTKLKESFSKGYGGSFAGLSFAKPVTDEIRNKVNKAHRVALAGQNAAKNLLARDPSSSIGLRLKEDSLYLRSECEQMAAGTETKYYRIDNLQPHVERLTAEANRMIGAFGGAIQVPPKTTPISMTAPGEAIVTKKEAVVGSPVPTGALLAVGGLALALMMFK